MQTVDHVRTWTNERLAKHRTALETMGLPEDKTIGIRNRITELKELLAALENKEPPVWIDAS